MKHKVLIILMDVFIAVTVSYGRELRSGDIISFRTRAGRVYTDVKIVEIQKTSIIVEEKGQKVIVPYLFLDDKIMSRLPSPETIEAEKAEIKEAQKKEQEKQAIKNEYEKEAATFIECVVTDQKKTNSFDQIESFLIHGHVLQVLDDGILIDGALISSADAQYIHSLIKQREKLNKGVEAMLNGSEEKTDLMLKNIVFGEKIIKINDEKWKKGTYFVTGITNSLADGENWKDKVYYVGLYQYIAVTGGKKTVRHYSTSRE